MKSMHSLLGSYAVTALALLALAFPGSAFAIAGKFEYVNGQVQVINAAGAPHDVSKGDVINQGDTISASANGFAQIKMEDGGFFAVRPDTQFKIDTFNFNGKEDGSEKGIFSLIKGSLRSVTGLIGKVHRDNYKILTASSTIGIRGSGADVGHEDSIGTAVHTLFGGHTLTSNGKTIETGPGQTALAAPGETPKFVPNFPFNTSTSPENNKQGGDKQGNNNKDQKGNSTTGNNNKDGLGDIGGNDAVIPIKTTNGFDLTKNIDKDGREIGSNFLPAGDWVHFVRGLSINGFGVEQSASHFQTYGASNYSFDNNGILTGVAASDLQVFDASGTTFGKVASNFTVLSYTGLEAYHTPDDSIYISRGSNVVVKTTCSGCSGTDTFISTQEIVGLASAPAFVQTLTGSNTYNLAGSTHPADMHGNVGTLNSATLSADFINQKVTFGVNIDIAGKTLSGTGTNVPIVLYGFDSSTSNGSLTVGCTPACTYAGDIGGRFFGTAAATAGLQYDFWPSADSTTFSDYISGLVAFTTSTPPADTSSNAALVGSGGAVVGTESAVLAPVNGYSAVDNTSFAARLDLSGRLIAFASTGGSGDQSYGASAGAASTDGSDGTLGVVWGRWSSYTANQHNGGANTSLNPVGSLAFITATHITTATELANYLSFTGSGLSGGNTIGTYNLVPGSVPTVGSAGGSITGASAVYSFSGNNFTSFSVTGSGGIGAFSGPWTVTGSGSLANFTGSSGLSLSNGPLNGSAKGNFVGNQAQGLISTVGLSDGSTYNLGAALYMKR